MVLLPTLMVPPVETVMSPLTVPEPVALKVPLLRVTFVANVPVSDSVIVLVDGIDNPPVTVRVEPLAMAKTALLLKDRLARVAEASTSNWELSALLTTVPLMVPAALNFKIPLSPIVILLVLLNVPGPPKVNVAVPTEMPDPL